VDDTKIEEYARNFATMSAQERGVAAIAAIYTDLTPKRRATTQFGKLGSFDNVIELLRAAVAKGDSATIDDIIKTVDQGSTN